MDGWFPYCYQIGLVKMNIKFEQPPEQATIETTHDVEDISEFTSKTKTVKNNKRLPKWTSKLFEKVESNNNNKWMPNLRFELAKNS